MLRTLAGAVLLITGLLSPVGLLFDPSETCSRLGRALIASPAPLVFLYSDHQHFRVKIIPDEPEQEVVISGNIGFMRRISGPLWRKIVYLYAFQHKQREVLEFGFCGGGRLGEDFGITGRVNQVVLEQWVEGVPQRGWSVHTLDCDQ